jgi:hypothetical protein
MAADYALCAGRPLSRLQSKHGMAWHGRPLSQSRRRRTRVVLCCLFRSARAAQRGRSLDPSPSIYYTRDD